MRANKEGKNEVVEKDTTTLMGYMTYLKITWKHAILQHSKGWSLFLVPMINSTCAEK